MKCILCEHYEVSYFLTKNNRIVKFRTTSLELAIKKAKEYSKLRFSELCPIVIERIQILESKSKEVWEDKKWIITIDKLGNVKKILITLCSLDNQSRKQIQIQISRVCDS